MSKKITVPENKKNNYFTLAYHVVITCVVIFLLFNYFFKNDKIAYVDSTKIFNEYKGAAEAKKHFRQKLKYGKAISIL